MELLERSGALAVDGGGSWVVFFLDAKSCLSDPGLRYEPGFRVAARLALPVSRIGSNGESLHDSSPSLQSLRLSVSGQRGTFSCRAITKAPASTPRPWEVLLCRAADDPLLEFSEIRPGSRHCRPAARRQHRRNVASGADSSRRSLAGFPHTPSRPSVRLALLRATRSPPSPPR
jgi:hypothetical protein